MGAPAKLTRLVEAANESGKTKHSCTVHDIAGILTSWSVSKHTLPMHDNTALGFTL